MSESSISFTTLIPTGRINECMICLPIDSQNGFVKISKHTLESPEKMEAINAVIQENCPRLSLSHTGVYTLFGAKDSFVGEVCPENNISLIEQVNYIISEEETIQFSTAIFYPNRFLPGTPNAGRQANAIGCTAPTVAAPAPKQNHSLEYFIQLLTDTSITQTPTNILVSMGYPIGCSTTRVKTRTKSPVRPTGSHPQGDLPIDVNYVDNTAPYVADFTPTPAAFLRVGLRYLFNEGLLKEEDLMDLCSIESRRRFRTDQPILCNNLTLPNRLKERGGRSRYILNSEFTLRFEDVSLYITSEVRDVSLPAIAEYFENHNLSIKKAITLCASCGENQSKAKGVLKFFSEHA